MTRLQQLFTDQGQSPWLDNLTRGHLRSGELARLVEDGIRGVTANPRIFEKAITDSSDYDDDFGAVSRRGGVEEAYWELVIADVEAALRLFRPLYEDSGGEDGFVSLELDPGLAHDTEGSVTAAHDLHRRIDEPNLLIKIPGTAEGISAVRRMVADGRSSNITLLFSLERYAEVIEAYLSGLEAVADRGGDLSRIHSVASFFLSRVDTEVDRRLDAFGTGTAQALRGRAAVAQAKLAYRLFCQRFSGPRWERLADLGGRVQRPLWASTSTKNPAYPDLLYVDSLIGPRTVSTMPDATVAAFQDYGALTRTVGTGVEAAEQTVHELSRLGVDLAEVPRDLEAQGVDAFAKSFDGLLDALGRKAAALGAA